MEKQIEGFSKYTFTNCGKVYRINKNTKTEILGATDKNGYLKITLVSDDKKNLYFRKHRLIAWAFLGENNMQVNHIDSNILNNNINNLEYVTSMENQAHRRKKEGYHVGVCWDKKSNKWRAYLQHEKKWKHLGFYNDFIDAKNAYLNGLKQLGITNKYA